MDLKLALNKEKQMKENINFIHETAIVEPNAKIGHMTKIWHFSHIDNNVRIGDNCSLGQNVYVGKGVKIGDGCKIQNNVFIPSGVIVGDNVFLGPSVTFTNVLRPDANINQHDRFLKTIVENNVTVGANATILPGVVLSEGSFVGAGSVVTKSTCKEQTVIGNPAKPFKSRKYQSYSNCSGCNINEKKCPTYFAVGNPLCKECAKDAVDALREEKL